MAAYFKLINKETKQEANLLEVDKEIYEHLNVPFDDKHWCPLTAEPIDGVNWYNIIGFLLACGLTYSELRQHISENANDGEEAHDNMLKVIDYLEEHYDVENWRCW